MMLLDGVIHVARLMLLQWISVHVGRMLLTFQTNFVHLPIWYFLIRNYLSECMTLVLVGCLTVTKTGVLADSRGRFLK